MTRGQAYLIAYKMNQPDHLSFIDTLIELGVLKVEESVKEQLIKEAREYVDPAVVRTSDPIDRIIKMANIIGRLLLYVK